MTPSDQYSSVRTVKQMAIEFLLNVQVAVCLFPYLARQNFCHPTVRQTNESSRLEFNETLIAYYKGCGEPGRRSFTAVLHEGMGSKLLQLIIHLFKQTLGKAREG